MAHVERGEAATDHPQADVRYRTWSTHQAGPREQFAYYREAVCKVFMDLTPEPPSGTEFDATVESISFGGAALNRLRFPGHTVERSASDIAASEQSCYYLNLKLDGLCQIEQRGRTIRIAPGQVGIFDSAERFTLRHERRSSLKVASFWVPHKALQDRLPAAFDFQAARLSDHPIVGNLIVETARTFNESSRDLTEKEASRLFGVLLDLVALAMSNKQATPEDRTMASALTIALRREILQRLRHNNLSVASVACTLGISERYVHKLFETTGTTFSRYVMDHRLDGAAADLRDPKKSASLIGAVAFEWGLLNSRIFREASNIGSGARRARGVTNDNMLIQSVAAGLHQPALHHRGLHER